MRNWKDRRGGSLPPSVDPAFADALAGNLGFKSRENRKRDYKALQLCRQVQRILTLGFGEFGGDEVLREVYVADVRPVDGSSQLLVFVAVPAGVSVVEVLERLNRAAPKLRAQVASAITRKRAPELSFVPVGPEGAGHE
jgi:ribosome-binding factor A